MHKVQISVCLQCESKKNSSKKKKKKKRLHQGGVAISQTASIYPAISVDVVTSLEPSQTVLNCSGTGSSDYERKNRTGVSE